MPTNELPIRDPEKCNHDVYHHGTSLGFFDMPKAEADAYCQRETERTGKYHDWHYVGGRVHIKVLMGDEHLHDEGEGQ